MSARRTDFLVHWTGKDIATSVTDVSQKMSGFYLERLCSILRDGLWMTVPEETIVGDSGYWIRYEMYMTCFTEIRLSQVANHTKKYGLLGVGVSRRFVLDRWGGPVWYVRNRPNEKIVGYEVHSAFWPLSLFSKEEGISDKVRLEQQNFYEGKAFSNAFLKGMSTFDETVIDDPLDTYDNLDEREWRIVVASDDLIDKGLILRTGSEADIAARKPGSYIIPLKADDIRILVVPDAKTKMNILNNAFVRDWFGTSAIWPPILSVNDCQQL